jgi:phospholipid/cholesterol/gamma-HCH transport system substrate-binding protein
MEKSSVEISVGIFVFIGLLCVGYLAIKLGKMEWIGNNYYPIYARFQSVSGLNTGAQIEMSGVQIGKVDSISLDSVRQVAVVKMKIKKEVVLTDDVIASVKTEGLIGDKYITISPGGSDEILKPGDMIIETESAVDLEELISKYVFGGV